MGANSCPGSRLPRQAQSLYLMATGTNRRAAIGGTMSAPSNRSSDGVHPSSARPIDRPSDPFASCRLDARRSLRLRCGMDGVANTVGAASSPDLRHAGGCLGRPAMRSRSSHVRASRHQRDQAGAHPWCPSPCRRHQPDGLRSPPATDRSQRSSYAQQLENGGP